MSEEVQALVSYRLVQAEQALAAARSEQEAGRFRDAINRAYYAMFYCGLALLASRRIGANKHSGLIAKVSELFVKEGPLPGHLGRALNLAFDLRQKADYREFFEPTPEQTAQVISSADEFLAETKKVLAL